MRYEANANQEEHHNLSRWDESPLQGIYRVRFHDYTEIDGEVTYTYSESSWDAPEDASAAVDQYCADNDLVILTRYHVATKPTRSHFTLHGKTDYLRHVSVDLIYY